MHHFKNLIALFLFFVLIQSTYAAGMSPVGFWKTIDDITGRPKAVIHIQETANKELFGTVVKIYPHPDAIEFCTACQGKRHNQPILGMTILDKLKKDKKVENMWVDGQILDPRSGKVYHCNIQTVANGEKLALRGYIGLPLFGRSQTWLRVEDPSHN